LLARFEEFENGPFSTSMVPEAERFPLWARMVDKWLFNAHVRQVRDERFSACVTLRVLPEIRFGWGMVGASTYTRARDITAIENDDIFLLMNLGGTIVGNGKRDEIRLAPGQAYVMSCAEIGSHASATNSNVLTLRARRDAMLPLVKDLDNKTGAVLPGDQEGLRLLSSYLRNVGGAEPLTSGESQRLATRHIHELFALALGSTDDAREAATENGLPAARLRAAKSIARRNLANPSLSASFIAGHLNISPRSLQRLFEADGTTFTGFVTAERIAKAHAALNDSEKFDLSVAEIALESGFGDISYFNRKFKVRYGASPSEVRFTARTLIRKM
jgi:AraC-like DNA-binding protein